MSSIRIPKTATAAEILKAINKWARGVSPYEHFSGEQRKLWDVLTALRGPDAPFEGKSKSDLKANFTEEIRAVLCNLASSAGALHNRTLHQETLKAIITKKVHDPFVNRAHFVNHSAAAAEALLTMIMEGELEDGPQG